MNADVARLVCKEYKISCAEFILREDVTVDQFIDVIEGNRAYIPCLYVFNKIDAITIEELDILDQLPVSRFNLKKNSPNRVVLTFLIISFGIVLLLRIMYLFHLNTSGI